MPSFDIVCKLDAQEIDNAIHQTRKEIAQRFDFKGTKTDVTHEGDTLVLTSADDFKVRALNQILREKLARRNVPLKALTEGPIEPAAGGTARQKITLQQGIATEKAREIVKLVKDTKLKVQVAIQGDQVRVTGKKRDDLQAIIQMLRGRDLGIAMQFVNFRD